MNPCPDLPSAPAPEIARKMAFMFDMLARQLYRHGHVLGVFLVPVWHHLNRSARIFARILALLAEGRLPAERPRNPRPPTERQPAATPTPAPKPRLPRQRGFLLLRLKHEAAISTQALEQLLADPDVRATLALSPRLVRRLRPLARLLGVTLPADFLPAVPARPKRAPRPPRAPTPEELHLRHFRPYRRLSSIVHPKPKFKIP